MRKQKTKKRNAARKEGSKEEREKGRGREGNDKGDRREF